MKKLLIVLCLLIATYAVGQNHFYVATSGSDSNDGSQAHPWATIAHADSALTLAATGVTSTCGTVYGSWTGLSNVAACVHVATGVYSGGPIVTTHNGTSTQRIVYVSDTQYGATVQLTVSGNCCVWIAHGLQMAIVGFNVTQSVATVNCVSGSVCNGTSGIVLANGPNEWAIANHIHNLHGDFADNSCNGNGGGPITVPNTGGNFIIGNRIEHNGGVCHFIHAIYMNSGNTVESNIINNNQDGIACGNGCNNALISNNTVFNNGGQGTDCAGSNGTDCQGSTLTNFGACLPMTSGVSHTQITAQNNVCVNNGSAGAFCDITNQGSAINNSRLSNNYIDNWASGNGAGSAKTSCINVNGGTGNTIVANTLTALVNGIKFVSYQSNGSGDYHLAAGSPGAGTATSGCTGGSTISPCIPLKDFDGNTRLSPTSIGAFENTSTGTGGGGGVNNYYVATTGSDSDTGAFGHPWHTIPHAISAFALGTGGAFIHVLNGTYPSGITISRGGSSSAVRLVLECDNGVASAVAAVNKCLITGTSAGFVVSAPNVDLVGFDIGGNANMGTAITTVSGSANSAHIIGNYIHDLGSNVSNSASVLGCPESGAINISNGAAALTDQQVLRNWIHHYGGTVPVSGCNTAQGVSGHGTPFVVEDNIVDEVPVGGIVLHDACNAVVSNNTVTNTKLGVILSHVDGTCSAYGRNTIANNAFFALFGSGAIFDVGGTAHCTGSTLNLFSHNISDGGVPDFGTSSGPFSCDTVSPGSFVTQAGSSFFVNYQTNGSGDSHLKSGSSGIDTGSPSCVSGGTTPCVPSIDFDGITRPVNSIIDVGAFEYGGTGSAPLPPTGVVVVPH